MPNTASYTNRQMALDLAIVWVQSTDLTYDHLIPVANFFLAWLDGGESKAEPRERIIKLGDELASLAPGVAFAGKEPRS